MRQSKEPLSGTEIIVTGSRPFAGKLGKKLAAEGARVHLFPTIEICPENIDLPDLPGDYSWLVFTSSNGVRTFFRMREKTGLGQCIPPELHIACIGQGTAGTLAAYGVRTDLVPEEYTSLALGRKLAERIRGGKGAEKRNKAGKSCKGVGSAPSKVLILRAADGSPDLTKELEKAGVPYTDLPIYRTEEYAPEGRRVPEGCTYITFASAGGVRVFFRHYQVPAGCRPVCIGEVSAAQWRKETGEDVLTAQSYSAEGICRAIERDWRSCT